MDDFVKKHPQYSYSVDMVSDKIKDTKKWIIQIKIVKNYGTYEPTND